MSKTTEKPADILEQAGDRLAQIEDLGKDIEKRMTQLTAAETAVAKADATRKDAKKRVSEISKEIKELTADLIKLTHGGFAERLFNKASTSAATSSKTEEKSESKPDEQSQPAASSAPVDPEAWRAVSVDTLGIKPAIVKKLKESKLETLGHISDFTSGDVSLTSIKGIGESAANGIETAIEKYFVDHPRPKTEDKPAAKDDFKAEKDAEEIAFGGLCNGRLIQIGRADKAEDIKDEDMAVIVRHLSGQPDAQKAFDAASPDTLKEWGRNLLAMPVETLSGMFA